MCLSSRKPTSHDKHETGEFASEDPSKLYSRVEKRRVTVVVLVKTTDSRAGLT